MTRGVPSPVRKASTNPHVGAFRHVRGRLPSAPTMVERRIRIRWRDVDNYGHVNNAVYLTYLEEIRGAWVRHVLGPDFDFVIVRIEIDYRSELSHADQEVTVRCRGIDHGASSIRTGERVLKSDGTVAAEAESVIVGLDVDERRAVRLTDRQRALVRAAIEEDAGAA